MLVCVHVSCEQRYVDVIIQSSHSMFIMLDAYVCENIYLLEMYQFINYIVYPNQSCSEITCTVSRRGLNDYVIIYDITLHRKGFFFMLTFDNTALPIQYNSRVIAKVFFFFYGST